MLGGLTGGGQIGAAQALASVCETHRLDKASRAIDDWLVTRHTAAGTTGG